MPRHATGRRPKPGPDSTVCVFKVALTDHKSVWRRVAIRSDQTLDDLHAIIFDAFDRFDEHLYSFYHDSPWVRRRTDMPDEVEYTSPHMLEEADPFGERDIRDASKTPLSSLGLKPGDTLYYLFDFGDYWRHELTAEQVDLPLETRRRYPFVMEKRGKSPPQYEPMEE